MSDNVKAAEITPESVFVPRREADSHKGDYGRVFIIGGSVGLTGAPVLSARAASKCGAGLTYLGVPKAVYEIAAVKLDEEMPFPLPDRDGFIAASAADEIVDRTGLCDACLIGPGLGTADDISELMRSIIRKADCQLILDADGLNAIAGNAGILTEAVYPPVLTPHPGEFVRLGGGLPPAPGDRHARGPGHAQRLRAAVDFAKKYNCILVLKGHRTVVALPDGSSYVNTTGGPAMAKGGSGDVLAGMIAAFVAQQNAGSRRTAGSYGMTIAGAVCNAVYLHGLAGDMCAKELGEYSVTATDIINMLPKAFLTVM